MTFVFCCVLLICVIWYLICLVVVLFGFIMFDLVEGINGSNSPFGFTLSNFAHLIVV